MVVVSFYGDDDHDDADDDDVDADANAAIVYSPHRPRDLNCWAHPMDLSPDAHGVFLR